MKETRLEERENTRIKQTLEKTSLKLILEATSIKRRRPLEKFSMADFIKLYTISAPVY